MKILFAYFDFTTYDNLKVLSHLQGEFPLNLSTKHEYSVIKETPIDDSKEKYQYHIVQNDKQPNETLPKNFWGDRIYNISAIVGNNGSGKTTIVHSFIKAIIQGLNPDVPFILVLQSTDSDSPYIYCNCKDHIGTAPFPVQSEYPEDLRHAKCMLLDNTLSISSLCLDDEYQPIEPLKRSQFDSPGTVFPYSMHNPKVQLYNRSLISSIRYSNENGQITEYSTFLNAINNHFLYESFQEIRFLFDRYQKDSLKALKEKKLPVPYPAELVVTIEPIFQKLNTGGPKHITTSLGFHYTFYAKYGLIGKMIGCLCNNFSLFSDNIPVNNKNQHDDEKIRKDIRQYRRILHNCLDKEPTSLNDAIFIVKDAIKHAEDYISKPSHQVPEILKINIKNSSRFVDFIVEKGDLLSQIFKPIPLSNNMYRIDLKQMMESNEEKQKAEDNEKIQCMITLLELYRLVCYPCIFLIFSSGLSSGEQNLLHMLTQFRYMLSGPIVYDDNTTPDNTGNCLLNTSPDEDDVPCDTLFLFLDEADLTYHPEWQRQFIAVLTTILPVMFRNPYNPESGSDEGCRDIQVIITTHSPLMLGDFPKASVICLGKEGITKQNTFGDNLYTILQNGFFMNDTIGEFAKHKINDVFNWCIEAKKIAPRIKKTEEKANIDYDKLSTQLNEHYKTVQLLSKGIIQSKLIGELVCCAEQLHIPFPENYQNDPAILKSRIDELETELSLVKQKLRKEGKINE